MKTDLSKLTVREANDLWAEDWADTRVRATHKLRNWEYARWERATCNPAIADITRETFIAFREVELATGISPASIEGTIMAVFCVLNSAVRRKVLAELPRRPRRLRWNPKRNPAVTLAEFNLFCETACSAEYPRHIRKEDRAKYWRTFLATCYFTGLRLGDVLRLKWSEISTQEITVVAQKTGKCQTIPIHPVLWKLLDELRGLEIVDWGLIRKWRKSGRHGFTRVRVFCHDRKTGYRSLHEVRTSCGLPKFTAQGIRKLAARQYEAAHGGAGGILLGHSLGVTGFYLSSVEILKTAQIKLAIPEVFSDLAPPQTDFAGVFAGLTAQQQQAVRNVLELMGVRP